MEDDLRPGRAEGPLHLRSVRDVRDRNTHLRAFGGQVALEVVEARLVGVQQVKDGGPVREELAGQLLSQVAGGPGNQDRLVAHGRGAAGLVDLDVFPAQQVIHCDLPQAARSAGVHHLRHAGHGAHSHLRLLAQADEVADGGAAGGGRRQRHYVHPPAAYESRDVVTIAEDGKAVDAYAPLARVVVHEADGPILPLRMLEELPSQHLARVPSPRDEDTPCRAAPTHKGRLRTEPRPQLRHAQGEEDQGRRNAGDGERDVARRQKDVGADKQDGDQPNHRCQAHGVGDAGVLPGGPVDTEEVVTGQIGQHDERYHLAEEDHRLARNGAVELEGERRCVAGDDEQRIQGQHGQHPDAAANGGAQSVRPRRAVVGHGGLVRHTPLGLPSSLSGPPGGLTPSVPSAARSPHPGERNVALRTPDRRPSLRDRSNRHGRSPGRGR